MKGQQHIIFSMETKQELSQNFCQNQALSSYPRASLLEECFHAKKTPESGQTLIECFPGIALVLLH